MKSLYLIICLSLFLTACGGDSAGIATTSATSTKLDVKTAGTSFTLDKPGVVYPSEMNFTAPGKPTVKTSSHYIFFANFDLDPTKVPEMRQPLTKPEQTRVEIQLTGEDGTKTDSPFKVGTYSAQAENANGLRMVKVSTFADGKQTQTSFDTMSMGKKAEGEVKITSVTADAVSGEVNLTEGDKSIKGTFTAKLPAAKK